jgi:putative transposase
VKANQAEFAVRTLCSVLRVSASGYYDWIERTPSQRAQANAQLMQRIDQVHRTSDATYGAPRIHAELVDEGLAVGKSRVARLMQLGTALPQASSPHAQACASRAPGCR